jgi:hypothetical protein
VIWFVIVVVSIVVIAFVRRWWVCLGTLAYCGLIAASLLIPNTDVAATVVVVLIVLPYIAIACSVIKVATNAVGKVVRWANKSDDSDK